MTMIATERLLLTADKSRLVRDGDPEGKTLYCTPGTEIPDSAARLFGLVDGTIGKTKGGKEAPTNPTKEKQPGGDKEKAPGDDKGAGSGTKGVDDAGGDDLTRIKFVGAKVAAGFVAAGLTSFAQIAAIDVAQPPVVEGTNATTKWDQIVESAKALAGTAAGDGSAGDAGDTDQGGA
jgi:predicted flap endonuclease-1-like 5' DNA nuclease